MENKCDSCLTRYRCDNEREFYCKRNNHFYYHKDTTKTNPSMSSEGTHKKIILSDPSFGTESYEEEVTLIRGVPIKTIDTNLLFSERTIVMKDENNKGILKIYVPITTMIKIYY